MTVMKTLLYGAALALLAGCSFFVPKLESPDLSVVNVELLKGDVFEQRLKVRMRVQNPNDRELPIKGISCEMEVNGDEFARGVAANSFVVPAFGEAEFDMMLTANMAGAVLRWIAGSGGRAPESLDYELTGKVALSSGVMRSIPFSEKGTFKLQ